MDLFGTGCTRFGSHPDLDPDLFGTGCARFGSHPDLFGTESKDQQVTRTRFGSYPDLIGKGSTRFGSFSR